MGLSFSVAPGLDVPPSLNNIYAELVREADDPALAEPAPTALCARPTATSARGPSMASS